MKLSALKLGECVYEAIGPLGQAYLDRIRYAMKILPRVNMQILAQVNRNIWAPPSHKALLIISADFELAWAWRYIKNSDNPKALALQKAHQTRQNLPMLLDLFDRFNIQVTWATVGHLFLEKCERQNGAPHPEITRLPYFTNEFWHYIQGDWFDADPCSDYKRDPAWYGPDLIRAILSAKMKHEIACHTFSHIDCSDDNCPSNVVDAELAECQRLAAGKGIKLKSFAFPGNLVGNLASLKRYGFSAYRVDMPYHLDYPCKDSFGLWQIPGGVSLEKPNRYWPDHAWVKVLRHCIDLGIQTGCVCHFWFHPSCEETAFQNVFLPVLEYIAEKRNALWVTTMSGLVEWLEESKYKDGV